MVASQVLRQSCMLSGLLFCSISVGYIFAQMSGMLDALYSRKDGIELSEDDISWIASSASLSSICGYALAAIITEKFGRKRALTFFCVFIVVNWIMLYYAETMIVFMISRILTGVCFGGTVTTYNICVAEYTSPKIRSLFVTLINSVGTSIGAALGHTFGIMYHWRTVALIGIVPAVLGGILPLFSEESPSWLASKGKFEACDKAFRRLHGTGAETELKVLNEVEKCKKQLIEDSEPRTYFLKKFIVMWKKKYIWKLLLLSSMINIYFAASGKILYNTLAITMLENITGSKDILLFTLLIDGFIILGSSLSCIFVKKMKMRTLLLLSGVAANILLLFLSAFLYFNPEKGGVYAWVNCVTLALFFIVVHAGPYPVLETFLGEMFPLEVKGFCFFLSGIVLSTCIFLSVKLANDLFTNLGYHGTFLLNASVLSACLSYVWIKMPETKGRTMQEIELYFKNDTFDEVERILKGEQINVLI